MSKQIRYTKGPIGKVRVVKDFLPPPDELAVKDELEKVALTLSKRSVDFFRREAKKHGTPYQRMIRVLLDRYAQMNAG